MKLSKEECRKCSVSDFKIGLRKQSLKFCDNLQKYQLESANNCKNEMKEIVSASGLPQHLTIRYRT